MVPNLCRNLIAVAALAATLSASPALAAGPKPKDVRAESPWQAGAGLWSAAARQAASWWKSQPPSSRQQSCQNGVVSCSANPKPPGDVGSAIDPDGKP